MPPDHTDVVSVPLAASRRWTSGLERVDPFRNPLPHRRAITDEVEETGRSALIDRADIDHPVTINDAQPRIAGVTD